MMLCFISALLDSATFAIASASDYAAGFQNPVYSASSNGSAVCITGLVPVLASATNVHINLTLPANQSVTTEIFVDMLQTDSTFAQSVTGSKSNISGTYMINARLCYPRATGINSSAVQILTHGIGYGLGYWDITQGFSYVDVAAAYGYTTLLYDRLGVGSSEQPDPIQVVQGPLEVSIAYGLIQMLRSGYFADTKFSKVIAVGHSFGSEITNAITVQYPSAVDAAILTGFSLNSTGATSFMSALNPEIASQNDPASFSALNNGYNVAANFAAIQWAFMRYPGFPKENLALAATTKQTFTFGELISAPAGGVAAMYNGIVDVVNGANDWVFCFGNCSYPTDLAAAVTTLYPKATAFSSYLAPVAGHGINLHYSATGAFVHIQTFLKTNGL